MFWNLLTMESELYLLSRIKNPWHESIKNKNVVVYPYAIYDYNGKLELVQRNASTFVKDLPASPALVNDKYTIRKNDTFEVECKVFNDIDPGNIELLSVDTEGCEWYVIKNLVSLPEVISLETHGKFYTNPFITEIKKWMIENGYEIWYKTRSDTVYNKRGIFKITLSEKIGLLVMSLFVGFRRVKRYLYN